MKKIFIVFAVAAASYACGGGESEKTTAPVSNNESSQNEKMGSEKKAESTDASATTTASAGNGKALIEASDCRTCHQDETKVIGPAYAEVAKKYSESDIKMLAEKIIQGGKGNWGEIPMTAHPNVSQSDAEEMVKYILSMKK